MFKSPRPRLSSWSVLGTLTWLALMVAAGCGPATSVSGPGSGSGGASSGSGGGNGPGSGGAAAGSGGTSAGSGGTAVAGSGGAPAGDAGTIVDPACDNQLDSVAPSINPPGGLAAANVPMFVTLGFDDNGYADGINWVLDNLRTRKNADGSAARATFFISGGFASEFFNNAGGQTEADLLNAWKKIHTDGHEVANHSWSHGTTLMGATKETWQAEMTKANDLFVSTLGVEKCKLRGFRTPFLGFSQATFDAMKAVGFGYDTSIEFGYDWWQPAGSQVGWGPGTTESGKHYYWPFTTDQAFPMGFALKGALPAPGMWEFPVYTFNKITGDTAATVTGFDFNLWTKCQGDSTFDFAAVLKSSLDQRLGGNRSPFAIGAHTDNYSQYNQDANSTWMNFNYQVRRKALADFIDYALTKPEVRFVTFRQLIDWMRHPKPL